MRSLNVPAAGCLSPQQEKSGGVWGGNVANLSHAPDSNHTAVLR